MNKYVAVYSVSDGTNRHEYVMPLYYKGTTDELYREFINCEDKLTLRWRLGNMLQTLGLVDNYNRTYGFQSYDLRIGSQYFNIHDFRFKCKDGSWKYKAPELRTLDEWFEEESGLDYE